MARRKDIARFRYNAAIVVAAVLALFGALPLALSSWWLAPIMVVPVAAGLWAARTGVDADRAGLRVRSAVASRRLTWAEVDGFVATGNQVAAQLTTGGRLPLPAVHPADVPRLVAASGQELDLASLGE